MKSRRVFSGSHEGNPTLSRRSLVRSLGVGSIGLLASLAEPSRGPGASAIAHMAPMRRQRDTRPNIILIVTDDMRVDDLAAMPAVQTLFVKQGTRFANFFVTSSTCAPARASILRGQYPHNHGVLRGKGEEGGFGLFHVQGRETSTIATWLQDAGYRTALIGKYLNGYPTEGFSEEVVANFIPPGWDVWSGYTKDGYFRFNVNENGEIVRYGAQDQAHYSTDVMAGSAVEFVGQAAQTGQPFFLYLAPRAPHGPAEPAPRHASTFSGTLAPRSPSFNEVDVSDKPSGGQAMPALSTEQIAGVDAYHAARLETLLAVDELVAALVDALRVAGTLDQTYLVFTSDNGYHMGEHRIFLKKGSPYEEAIRVPLLVRGPGVAAGQTIEALTSQVDLAPTFAAWAGASVPDFVDGRSLAPLLAGEPAAETWRQSVLIQHSAGSTDPRVGQAEFVALRTESILYVEFGSGEREAYDLADDPYELENLAARSDPEVMQTLSERLSDMMACSGDACRAIETSPVPSLSHSPKSGEATRSRLPVTTTLRT